MPPVFPRILRYVAVDMVCRERVLREAAVPEGKVHVIFNFADTALFLPRPTLPARPMRALVFGNNACETNYAATVRAACAQSGILCDLRGMGSSVADEPHALLPHYDIVFAKGRAAIEAMAVGCAVVLCSDHALGPMVSSANFAELRLLNFGFRTMRAVHTVETIAAALRAYDPADAAKVRDTIRSQGDMRVAVAEIVRIYREAVAENARLTHDPVAELRAMGAYLQTLDTVLKHGPFGTPIIAPPVTPPDAIALAPGARPGWLRRIFRFGK
jgi:hypothetical protein